MIASLSPRTRVIAATAGLVVLAAVYTQLVLPGPKGGARGTPMAILFEGLLLGLLSGLVACALVLIYRVQVFINFAAFGIGAVAAWFATLLIRLTPVPFFVDVALGLLAGALLGAVFELLFVRRFFDAPRLTLTVMTVLAVGALLGVLLGDVEKLGIFPPRHRVDPQVFSGPIAPRLPFPGLHFSVGGLDLRFGFGALFALWTTAICLAGLGWFFRYTRSGTAVRALAENPDRAELLGISTRRLSTVIWTITGVLAAATALASTFIDVSANPSAGDPQRSVDALLIPLIAAVVARMRSFAGAVGAAAALTVVSTAIGYSYPGSDGAVTAALFVTLCVALLVQHRTLLRSEARTGGGWESTEEVRPLPSELRRVPSVRWARLAAISAGGVFAVLFPFFFSTRLSSLGAGALLFGIVALSLVVLTGWAGQISLGQVGLMAVGALVGGSLITKVGIPFWIAVPLTAAITGVVALVIGIPALRVKGLFLAAVTFAFGVTVNQFFFDKRYVKWLQPKALSRPRLFFIDFADQRSMYYLSLVALIIAVLVVLNLRRSRFGRVLIAMRENEAALQAVGVPVVRTKLLAFMVSGALAGYAGVVYAVLQRGVSAGDYTSARSLQLFAFTVVGGVTSAAGALLGQIAEFVLNRAATNNDVWTAVVGFLPLILLYIFPGGIIGILQSVRDAFLRIVAQRHQIVVPSLFADYDVEALERRLIPLGPPLEGALNGNGSYRGSSSLYPDPASGGAP
ncbi:MAG: ABC transporter permease subunit [Acidimicrobiales bacterium]